jgi:hypothetical protein
MLKLIVLFSLFIVACGGSVDSTEVTSVVTSEPCDAGANAPDAAPVDPCANPPCEDGGNGTVYYNGMQLQCMCPKR